MSFKTALFIFGGKYDVMLITQTFKMYKGPWILIFTMLLYFSCEKDESIMQNNSDQRREYSPEIRFNITGRLLEGKKINCIETDKSTADVRPLHLA